MAAGDPVSLSAHWMHEWLHVSGFRHSTSKNEDVNYTVGRLVAQIAAKHAIQQGAPMLYVQNIAKGYHMAMDREIHLIDEEHELA